MKVITAFGDSVLKGVINTDGRYALSKSSFVHICEEKLGIQVVNKAVMGATITKGAQVFERAKKTVAESSDDEVILEFGGNDCDYDWNLISEDPDADIGPRTSIECFREEYVSLLKQIIEIGKKPVMLSLPPIDSEKYFSWITRSLNADNILKFLGGEKRFLGDWHEAYNLEVFRIAYENEVKLIDISSCFLKTKNYYDFLCVDGIHPNEKGHELIAAEICRCYSDWT